MQNLPPPSQTPRWLSRARLTAGAAGLAAAALSLASCGQGKVNTSVKRERAEVRRETGELPPAGTAKRLEKEQSVFLRQHAKDPVDWYPWGEEAFAKARTEGKLVLVSIGYASCPWSQRMQEETFSDPVTARFMNRHFVNVLVDCGERTEVNNIYINFLFWRSRQSGWPLHLWLTPEGLPVFSGNYFPATATGNQASWNPIIEHVHNSYAEDPAHVREKALETVREYGREYRKLWKSTGEPPAPAAQAVCFDRLRSMFDPVHGGFTQAPKFALPYALEFLLNHTARFGEDRVGRKKEAENMLSVSLSNLVRGGIHDQLGGGFHRYSMDIYWAVPQFEKMLYDQGALAGVLAEAAVTLNRPEWLETAREVLAYTDRELGQPDGGFSGAQSSSSPASGDSGALVEGGYYQWSWEEMEKAAGAAAMPLLRAVYDVDDQGNIPVDSPAYTRMRKVNVLRIVRPLEEAAGSLGLDPATARKTLDTARAALLEARNKRPQPLLDNTVVTSWNGAAISGFARAGWALNDPTLTDRAGKAADFVLGRLRQPDGALVHSWLDAPSPAPAGSEDYAMMIRGLLDLYEATGTARWLKEAAALQDKQNALLWDPQEGGFFDGAPQPFLFNRLKSADESTEFAPAAVSTLNQARLGWLLNRTEDLAKARTSLNTFGSLATNAPATFLRLLLAADLVARPPLQIVITGAPDAPDRAALLAALRQRPSAGTVRLYLDGGEGGKLLTAGQPSLEKLTSPPGRTTLHFCRNFEPLHSITDPAQVKPWLEAQALTSP